MPNDRRSSSGHWPVDRSAHLRSGLLDRIFVLHEQGLTMPDLRDEFEAWARSEKWLCDRNSFGEYIYETTRDGWHAYQAATERAAKKEREAMLSADDMADLQRLSEVFDDGEGWDLPKVRMKRLAELGVVRWHGVTRYSITSFGLYCLGELESPLMTVEEYNAKAYADMLERNGIDAAAIRAREGKGGAG